MLALLIVVLAILFLIAATIWFLTEMEWGFFRPVNNVEFVILRGNIFDHSIRDDICYRFEKDAHGKWVQLPPVVTRSLLYRWFGIRYFGFPFVYKIGKIIINYPNELRSTSGVPHKGTDIVPGLTVHHNYQVGFDGVDFQGGISFKINLNLEVRLKKSFVAWGRNGKFLASLTRSIESAVKTWALNINATEFIGKTENTLDDRETAKKRAEELRSDLCKACIQLNTDTNKGGGTPFALEDSCGYEIASISYSDIEPGNDESKTRLAVLEEQNQVIIETIIAEQKAKTAEAEAKAAATRITAPGMAQVAVNQAAGMAEAKILAAKVKAAGQDVVIAEFNAKAIKETHLSTMITSTNGAPPPSLILPPPKPDAEKPTPK